MASIDSVLGFKIQDIVFLMFILILAFLVFSNWRGVNALLSTAASSTIGLTRTLQGRT